MVDINSFLQIFATISIIGIFVSFLIRVSIQALILRIFTKKYQLPQNYGKAWLVILIPSLIVALIVLPLAFIGLPDFLAILIWLLFFPILIFSIKLVYKTETKISTAISLKYFILILVLVIVFAGIQTLLGATANPLDSNVPQSVCTLDCEFAYRTDGYPVESLTVTGYNIPTGKYQEKENYIIAKKTFSKNEIDNMERGVNEKIIGKLDAKSCSFMEFSKEETGGGSGGQCKGSSKSFFTNLKKILVG